MLQRMTLYLAALSLAAMSSAAHGRTEKIVTSPGIEIHVIDEGSGTEPALVFIPGWGMPASVWRKQIAYYSENRRVIAVDPRSQGQSTITSGDVSPEARARDLHILLEKLGLTSAILVGWSQGIQDVAAYLGAFGPGKVAGIVLVDGVPHSGAENALNDTDLPATLRFANMFLTAPEAYAEGMVSVIFDKPLSREEKAEFKASILNMPPAVGTAMIVSSFYGRNRIGIMAKYCVPTVVIAAAGAAGLERQRSFAGSLKDGRFEVVEDSGHALFYDQPERFNAVLSEFLKYPGLRNTAQCELPKP